MKNRWPYLIFAVVIGLSAISTYPVHAQEATPGASSTNVVECNELGPDEDFTVLVLASGETRPAGTILVLRDTYVDGNNTAVDVRAECLAEESVIEVPDAAWEGYPTLAYARVDACIEAQRFAASNPDVKVTFDKEAVPADCTPDPGVVEGDNTVQVGQGETVPAGTIAVYRRVTFGSGEILVGGEELLEDLEATWNQAVHVTIWTGYDSVEDAQEAACDRALEAIEDSQVPRSWNEGFEVMMGQGEEVLTYEEVCGT